MPNYRDPQPHGDIKEIFADIFMVTGTNKTSHNGIEIQVSRNMIIVREGDVLSLINTVRLNEAGLQVLATLGKVTNVIRIGAFHGYDDEFYLDHYQAKLWGIKGMQHQSGRTSDYELVTGGVMPFSNCTLFNFESTVHREGILLLDRPEGNVLITCDSIQNWTAPDEFFSDFCAKMFQEQGFIKTANIPDTWIGACSPEASELAKIKTLHFSHLLSAHGEPLKNNAHEMVCETLKQKFNL